MRDSQLTSLAMDNFTRVCVLGFLLTLSSLVIRCQEEEEDGDEEEAGADEFGGVNIKVFRGPTSRTSAGEMFAPFGYYVTMPVAAPGPYNNGPEEENISEEEPEQDDF